MVGTAFKQLRAAESLTPILRRALSVDGWQDRQEQLSRAFEYIATQHNQLGLTEALPEKTTPFFSRPFRVIWGEKFSRALCAQITEPVVRHLTELPLIGSVDQFSDNTDLVSDPRWRPALRNLWQVDKA